MDWISPLRLARSLTISKDKSVPKLEPKLEHAASKSQGLRDLTAAVTIYEYIKGGGHADIRKASLKDKNGYKVVVVKQLRCSETAAKLVQLEMNTWRRASGHENVVHLLGKFVDNRGFPSMVAEYCEQGDLLSYTFTVARFNHKDLLLDILKGLKHVHGLSLAHGDLKPENIVLTTQSKRLVAKICDFGSARDLSSFKRVSLEYTCTALYRSPELSSSEEEIMSPSYEADIWALGCVAYVMLCKKMPYHWVKNRWTIDMFIASNKPPHSDDDKWPDSSLRRLVQSCWSNKERRPSANALLNVLISTKPGSRTPSQLSKPPTYPTVPSPIIISQPAAQYPGMPSRPYPISREHTSHVPDRPRMIHSYSSRSFDTADPVAPPYTQYTIPSQQQPMMSRVGSSMASLRMQFIQPSSESYSPLPVNRIDSPAQSDRSSSRRSRSLSPRIIRIDDSGSGRSRSRSPLIIRIDAPIASRQHSSHSPEIVIPPGSVRSRSRSRSHTPTRIVYASAPPESPREPSRSPTRIVDLSPSRSQSLSSSSSGEYSYVLPPALSLSPAPIRPPSIISTVEPELESIEEGSSGRSRSRPIPSAQESTRSRSRSPTRVVYVGGSRPRSRSRTRSPHVIETVEDIDIDFERNIREMRRARPGPPRSSPIHVVPPRGSRSPTRHRRSRRQYTLAGDDFPQHSHSYPHSRSVRDMDFETPPIDPVHRGHERSITLNINITINSEGEIRVGSPRIPNSTTRRYNIRHTVDLPRGTREVESPIQIRIPTVRNGSRSDHSSVSPTVIRPVSPETTDSSYASTVLRGSAMVPEPVPAGRPTRSSVLGQDSDETLFLHKEYYTNIRCVMVDGRKVVQKSIRRSVASRIANHNSSYLNYARDMLRLKHDHLVEILEASQELSIGSPVLSMVYYSTDLLSYREHLDQRSQLRVFCEILEGLNALHTSEPPIAHQCLKASNIMIDINGSVKLSLANSEPYLAFSARPTPSLSYSSDWPIISRWWSPDVYRSRDTMSRAENDIWAFGCVMLEVLTGSVPYPTFGVDPSLVQHILVGNTPDSGVRRPPRANIWRDMRRCWSTPRPTASILLDSVCDQLSREIFRKLPDLTGKVARTMDPFVRGYSADIYSGTYTERTSRTSSAAQKSVAVKHVMPNYAAEKSMFLQWLGACAQYRAMFNHPNICQLLGVMYTAKLGPLLVYEYCSGGNLSDYLRTKGQLVAFQDKLRIMSGVLDALVHLHHQQDSAWGDLHPGNILLDGSGNPKLCGLGPRPSIQHQAASKSDLLVIRYFGPERFLADATLPDQATDVWAFGCLIVKILSGQDPYRESRTAYGVIRAVASGRRPYEKSDCESLPLWYIASSCWTEGLLQRPMAAGLARRIEGVRA